MPKHNYKKNNKRRPIEIYFILYLVALVILISGKNSTGNENNVEQLPQMNVDLPFRIKAEKPLLMCKISIDSLGNRELNIDSLNYIWDYGDVESVLYEFVVEDQELRHSIRLTGNSTQSNKYFSFVNDKDNRMTIFHWTPEIFGNENKTFIVYVTATAIERNSASNSNKRITAKTQFSLVIANDMPSFVANDNANSYIQSQNPPINNQFQQNIPNNNYYVLSGDYRIEPQTSKIKAIAAQEWENEINCYGISPRINLSKSPIIKIQNIPENNGGTVNSPIIKDNSIQLKGKVPAFGHSKVSVTLVRNGDLRESTVSFYIAPIVYGLPDIPNKIYPVVEYSFAPNLSNDMDNINIYIKDKEVVRFQSFQNTPFKFVADLSDTGKTLSFERYVNGQLLGQKYNIKVVSFPEPNITRIALNSKNEAILEVTSFGIFNGKDNNINEIKIIGNGKALQQYGKYRTDRKKLEYFEQFKIISIDKNKPFAFEAIAIDQCGARSKPKFFTAN